MLTRLPPSQMFLCTTNSFRVIPQLTQFGEIQLRKINQIAQAKTPDADISADTLEQAQLKIDLSYASLKEQVLIE